MSETSNIAVSPGERLLFLLQTATGVYPTGAFNHSLGFETLVEEGIVTDAKSLREAGRNWLLHGLAPVDGIAVRAARAYAQARCYKDLAELDCLTGNLKITREAREASIKTGQALTEVTRRVFGGEAINDLSRRIESAECEGHQATAFGAAVSDAGLEEGEALTGFLHSSLATVAGVIARLVPLGQTEVQGVLYDWWPDVREAVEIARMRRVEEMAAGATALDIAGMRHETLGVRLCMS